MKMKSIEETHPSIERTFRAHKDASEFVLGKDVQKHTIDKAVLREAITETAEKFKSSHLLNDVDYELGFLLNRLGLKKEE